MLKLHKIFLSVLLLASMPLAFADSDEQLAIQLTNPVADLISIPFQFNYNTHINTQNTGHQTYMNFQPVIPIKLNPDWNVISRTILPVTNQVNILPGSSTQFGLGDTLQSFFLSPVHGSVIWGAGPAISIPTGTQTLLGSGKWGLGPTVVVLKLIGPWTVGVLANQVWSVAGNSSRPATSQMYWQPFLAYTTKNAWTYSLNSESTYDWKASAWSVPFNAVISKLTHVGGVPISIGGGLRYWAYSPESGAKDLGARFAVTLLLPNS